MRASSGTGAGLSILQGRYASSADFAKVAARFPAVTFGQWRMPRPEKETAARTVCWAAAGIRRDTRQKR
jgi:hypothetical protein